MVAQHHYIFFKNHRVFNTKSEPYVNYGIWAITMYQCKFINYNKYTTLAGSTDNRGDYAYMRSAESLWKLSVLSAQF